MRAQSFLGSVRAIDRRLEALLSATVLAGSAETWTHAVAVRETLVDVAEQLRAGTPLPASSDAPTPEDGAFFGVLAALAESDDQSIERVEGRVEGGERAVAELRDRDRVEVRHSTVVVPLGRNPGGENWWALLEYLRGRITALATKADRVRGRVVADGGDELLVLVWDSVAEMLGVLRDVVDGIASNGRYAGRRVRTADGSSPTEFVAWTAEQFRREQ